eukprot:TRINITY_DN7781_c0_g1_i8.p1 TRINITY_DN7781_c0_g1~~TRINITY_DN7781_c0_g1_i8.p1  ORF type:complete len:213 (+),score=32.51 TRINITY_DN7781_c0_g1_i8:230-868(+)
MRNIGPSDEVQSYLNQYKYGIFYFENEAYFHEFLNLKQKELSVDEYTRRFQKLQHPCALNERELHDVTRFMSGLNPDTEEKMKFCQTIQEACKDAIRVERILRQSHIQQYKSQERRSQERKAHIIETHFSKKDNPKLVIHRLLTTNKMEEEDWTQYIKFQTHVRCKGKLANLVIDRSSAINFIAQEVIDKLHWPSKKLLKPYRVTWANDVII